MARVVVYPRDVFVQRVWKYQPGEHVTFVGKTQSGKTTLAFQLLQESCGPTLPAIVLVMKPRDSTPERWGKRLGLRRVRTWPPPIPPRFQTSRPPGWLLWPRMGDIRRDDVTLREQFDSALTESYAQAARKRGRQDRILFADEVVGLAKQLRLETELDAVWMRGSSMGVGLWAATQRPFHAPQLAYSQPVHIFLHRDPDERNRKRLREIGGVNHKTIEACFDRMAEHQFLYIRRTDYTMCIVDA